MEETKRARIKAIFIALGIMLLYLLIQLVISIVMTIAALYFDKTGLHDSEALTALTTRMTPVITLISNIACFILFGLWYYLGYVRKDKVKDIYSSGIKKIWDLKSIVFLICTALALYFIGSVITGLVEIVFPENKEMFNSFNSIILGDNYIQKSVLFFAQAIIAPISIEFAFRGIILQKLKTVYGITGYIVISTILFSLMFANPIQIMCGIPIGIVVAFIAYMYNSIVPTSIILCIINSVTVIIPMIYGSALDSTANIVLFLPCLVLSVLLYKKIPALHK